MKSSSYVNTTTDLMKFSMHLMILNERKQIVHHWNYTSRLTLRDSTKTFKNQIMMPCTCRLLMSKLSISHRIMDIVRLWILIVQIYSCGASLRLIIDWFGILHNQKKFHQMSTILVVLLKYKYNSLQFGIGIFDRMNEWSWLATEWDVHGLALHLKVFYKCQHAR